jgi:tight adherence protein C
MSNISLDLTATLAAVFVSVALVSGLVASRALSWAAPARRRVRELATLGGTSVPAGSAPALLVKQKDPAWERLKRGIPKSAADMNRLQVTLAHAGFRRPGAVVLYSAAELVLPVVFGGTAFLVLGFTTLLAWGAVLLAAAVGFFLPSMVLGWKINRRRRQVRNGLPDVLDLLIVCLEAGSSLDQALMKASEDLEIAYPFLADELRTLNVETRAGKPRIEAFRNLAQRTKVDDVRALVAMLVQTDRFGTSVSQALRTFAASLRTRRRQEAEERAAKVGVKLVVPLVLCFFPAFFVVTLGPAIIRFARVFLEIPAP